MKMMLVTPSRCSTRFASDVATISSALVQMEPSHQNCVGVVVPSLVVMGVLRTAGCLRIKVSRKSQKTQC